MKVSFDELVKKMPPPVQRVIAWLVRCWEKARELYGVTADATKLYVEKEQRVVNAHIDYHRLGAEVFGLMRDDPDVRDLRVSDSMRQVVRRIISAQNVVDHHMAILDRITVVEKQT